MINEYTYEVIITERNTQFILRSDGAHIPINESNSDYQAYLKWTEEQKSE